MTFLWLIFWLAKHTPPVHFTGHNSWAVGLVVCIAIDLALLAHHDD